MVTILDLNMTILNIGIMAASDCSNTVLSSLLTYMAFISIHGPNHNLAISRGVEHTLAEESFPLLS